MHRSQFTLIKSLLIIFMILSAPVAFGKKGKPLNSTKHNLQIDWQNRDTLMVYWTKFLTAGDKRNAVRVADSLIQQLGKDYCNTQWQEIYFRKLSLQTELGQHANVQAQLHQLPYEALFGGDCEMLYERAKAQLLHMGDHQQLFQWTEEKWRRTEEAKLNYQTKWKSVNDSLQAERTQNEIAKRTQLEDLRKQKQINLLTYSALILLLIACVIRGIVAKNKGARERQKLEQQMRHTQTQIEKAHEHEERINEDIKKMKEEVSRLFLEKNTIKQNITNSTSETLPLLKTQIDQLAKDAPAAIPVEKYMQLQNTITRLNKQLRDLQ